MSTKVPAASKAVDAREAQPATELSAVVAEDMPLHSYEVFSATLEMTEATIRRLE